MTQIGLFYGQMGGYTRNIADMVKNEFATLCGEDVVAIHHIKKSIPEDIRGYELLIFGAPTYQHGKLDDEWDDFLPQLKKLDFAQKKVALFGLGNAVDFPDSFAGGIGVLAKIVKEKGATLIGTWHTEGYEPFLVSPAKQDDFFVGLIIDEMSQADKTKERVQKWVQQIKEEFGL